LIEHLLLVLKKLYKAHFLLHRSREAVPERAGARGARAGRQSSYQTGLEDSYHHGASLVPETPRSYISSEKYLFLWSEGEENQKDVIIL
jgi:hypothetical protein